MAPILFSIKDNVSFESFVSEIKNGRRDFLKILKTPEENFENASFEELLSNISDILSGVNKVQKNFSQLYFNIFNGCLIKHHDNGDIKFVFYTTTSDYNTILKISSILFKEFGQGVY